MKITKSQLKQIIKEELGTAMAWEDKPEIDIDAESYGLSPQWQVAKYLSDPKTWAAYQGGVMADSPYLSPMWQRSDWEEVLDEWADEIKLDGRSVFGGYPSPTKPPPDALKSFVDFARVLILGARKKGMFEKHDKFKDTIRWILAVIDEKTAGYGNQADEGWREMYQGLHELYYNQTDQIGKIDKTHFDEKRSQYLSESRFAKSQLRQIIKEELSDYVSNIYKWCPSGSKCSPERKKTKWWKGR
jgi:hypothetical protein